MLVLLSFALVLVATVLLVLGLLNDSGLALIYISIASSVAAAVVLLIALRLNKPRAERAEVAEVARPLPEPETVAVSARTEEWMADDKDSWSDDSWDDAGEVDFPIADYDDLTVAQILPLLPQLYADEIGVVEARERATKSRPSILDKLAQLSGAVAAPAAATATPAKGAARPAPSAADEWFPIEGYESLSAAQVRPLLGELDDDELALVRTRELSLGRRPSVLYEIDRRLGTAAAPARKAPAREGPAGQEGAGQEGGHPGQEGGGPGQEGGRDEGGSGQEGGRSGQEGGRDEGGSGQEGGAREEGGDQEGSSGEEGHEALVQSIGARRAPS